MLDLRQLRAWIPAYGVDESRDYVLSQNAGDDIQSLALARLLRLWRVPFGRYERNTLRFDGEPTPGLVFLTGWYSHAADWPPSALPDGCVPVFLGYHDHVSRKNGRLDELRQLALASPYAIGCRDRATVEVFREAGVPAGRLRVSRCVTLLSPWKRRTERKPLAVDIPEACVPGLRRVAPGEWRIRSHHIPEDVAGDPAARRQFVRARANDIREASVVVTTRLHAALPAVAMGIPVVLVVGGNVPSRLRDYLSLFRCVSSEVLASGSEQINELD